MKIILWIIAIIMIGVVINFIDTPSVRSVSKIIIGWGIIFLAIIGIFALMNRR